MSFEGE